MNTYNALRGGLLVVLICSFGLTLRGQQFSAEEAISYALTNNPSLKSKMIEARTAEEDIKEVKAIGMPQVSGSIGYQYYPVVPQQPVEDFISPAVYGVLFQEGVLEPRQLADPEVFEFSFFQPNNLSANIQGNALIFDGSYIYALKGARLYRELISNQIKVSEVEVKAAVKKAYIAVLITEENLKMLEKNISTLEKSYSEVLATFKEGFAESLDVDRIQLSLDNLNNEKKKLTEVIKISKNFLKFQMGYPIEQDITLTESLDVFLDEVDQALLLDQGIDFTKRAETSVLDSGDELNEINLKRYKASYLPSLRASVGVGANLQRQNLFDNDQAGWLPQVSVGLSANIPIYDGGDKKAKIAKVKLDMEKASLQRDQFESSVNLQVTNAKINFRNAKTTLDNVKRSLDINQRIYDKTKIKYDEGVGSSLEVTTAEGSLFQAQTTYINALYDLVLAKTELDIALGNDL